MKYWGSERGGGAFPAGGDEFGENPTRLPSPWSNAPSMGNPCSCMLRRYLPDPVEKSLLTQHLAGLADQTIVSMHTLDVVHVGAEHTHRVQRT